MSSVFSCTMSVGTKEKGRGKGCGLREGKSGCLMRGRETLLGPVQVAAAPSRPQQHSSPATHTPSRFSSSPATVNPVHLALPALNTRTRRFWGRRTRTPVSLSPAVPQLLSALSFWHPSSLPFPTSPLSTHPALASSASGIACSVYIGRPLHLPAHVSLDY